MRRLPSFPFVLTCLLCTAVALEAQIPLVTIVPSGGTYDVGTQVAVTIEYCSANGYFDGSPGVEYNGFEYAGMGSYVPGYRPECVDFGTWTGTVTIAEGQNTLHSWIMAALYGDMTAVYTSTPPTPPPAEPPVVTPDAEPMAVSPAIGAVQRFEIYNPGTDARSFTLTTGCGGSVSGCAVQSSIYLLANQTGYVVVTYNVAGALNAAGTVLLTATDGGSAAYDTGSLSVKVAPSGPVIERGLCLTIAAGGNAAYECGDLRIVHPLPSVRTLNQTRTPTLMYSSQHAHPFPLLHSDVTFASWETRPDSVIATVRINGAQKDRRAWAGSQWPAGQTVTRKVAAGFNASALSTDLYAYQLEIGKKTGGNYVAIRTESGTLPIVNRASSPFGAGWWLAGFEKLQFLAGGAILWIGGDGSVRRYEQAGTLGSQTVYLATPVDGPDSLLYNPGTAQYSRLLKGGGTVAFNSSGFHIRTVNRLGYVTSFVPDSYNRLWYIYVAGDTLSADGYTFAYAGGSGILQSVSAPDSAPSAARVVTITPSGNRIWRVADLTKPAVEFTFDATYPNRIVGRKDARNALWTYAYDAAGRLQQSSLNLAGDHTIRHGFCDGEAIGIAACGATLRHPDSTYTVYDGPRAAVNDTLRFLLDRFGGVRQTRDAYGYVTSLARTDPRWPALVTRTLAPNGRILAATYDRRGNLASTIDSSKYAPGQHATTRYEWHQRWDQLTQVTLPNGQLTRFGVDAANGNRLWTEDARGASSRVSFEYYASGNGTGMPSGVVLPGGARTSMWYDARGNADSVRTPLGWTTRYINDRLGRTTLVQAPIGPQPTSSGYRNDSTVFDGFNRPIRSASYALGAGTVTVSNSYDNEDNLYRVERSQNPNPTGLSALVTQWVFDALGQPTSETAPDGAVEVRRYDQSGNVDTVITRRGHILTMAYDRMNRLMQRIVPAVHYGPADTGIAKIAWDWGPRKYPWYTSEPDSGLTILGETEAFEYDLMGNLIAATNSAARVRRGYFNDGQIRADTLKIMTYEAADSTKHVYVTRYVYDVNGRLVTLKHPSQLAPRVGGQPADSVRYAYDATTGELADVYDLLGNRFHYGYNPRGERVRIEMPGGFVDSLGFDIDGRLALDRIRNAGGLLYRNARLTYRHPMLVDSAINQNGWLDTTVTIRSGLGHLLGFHFGTPTQNELGFPGRVWSSEQYNLDPLGNLQGILRQSNLSQTEGASSRFSTEPNVTRNASFDPATGRLAQTSVLQGNPQTDRVDAFLYDAAGNLEFVYQPTSSSGVSFIRDDRVSYYGADGRLRVAEWRRLDKTGGSQVWTGATWRMAFEEYRYDALGRRVLVRTRRDCGYLDAVYACNRGFIRRTVWDGARELWELQQPGRDDGQDLERDSSVSQPRNPSPYFDQNPLYGNVAYTYGFGVDQPLSVLRTQLLTWPWDTSSAVRWPNLTLIPHWNWRGEADYTTFADGSTRLCLDPLEHNCLYSHSGRRSAGAYQQQATSESAWGWFGTLLAGKADATGTQYRRNRYLDPVTGRFTQEDPIGLAGGLNLYGFANGDPVSFSDPFGLSPEGGDPCKGLNVLQCTGRLLAPFQRVAQPVATVIANSPLLGMGGMVGATSSLLGLAAPLSARAATIQAASGVARAGRTTTAVVQAVTDAGDLIRVVGTSEGRLRTAQVAALQDGEVAAAGVRGVHAEINAISYAVSQGWRVIAAAASRPVCPACADVILSTGAKTVSALR